MRSATSPVEVLGQALRCCPKHVRGWPETSRVRRCGGEQSSSPEVYEVLGKTMRQNAATFNGSATEPAWKTLAKNGNGKLFAGLAQLSPKAHLRKGLHNFRPTSPLLLWQAKRKQVGRSSDQVRPPPARLPRRTTESSARLEEN